MTAPTRDDIYAARALLGMAAGPAHAKMEGLTGADLCIHSLTGSGVILDDFEAQYGKDAALFWRRAPYRHHVFMQSASSYYREGRRDAPPVCMCGNYREDRIHTACWEGLQ